MAIAVTLSPPDLALSKNAILFKANTDQYIPDAGSAAEYMIFSISGPVDGETVVLEFLGFTFTYTWRDVATGCMELQIPVPSTIVDNQETLYLALLKNYHLREHYNLFLDTGSTNDLYITAKEPGSEYDIIISGDTVMGWTDTAGNDPVIRTDFRIYWDLFISAENADTWEKVVGQDLSADADQNINPDMAELLHSRLAPDLPLHLTNLCAFNVTSLKDYHVRHAEYYLEEVHCYNTEATRKVMLAGQALEKWAFTTFLNIYGAGIADQLFLTNQPRIFDVAPDQQTFLCLLVSGAFVVKADITWDDDTTTTETLFNEADPGKSWTLIPTGYTVLNLLQYLPIDAERAESYTIYVEQGANTSEEFTYQVDHKFRLNPRHFIFHNSLNGWDSIFCTGDQARNLNTAGEDYNGPVLRNLKTLTAETALLPASTKSDTPIQQRWFEINTGHKSKEYVQYLSRELPLSQMVLWDDGERWVQLKVKKDSIKEIDNDANDLWSLTFTYELGYQDLAF